MKKRLLIFGAASVLIVGLNFRASTSATIPPPGHSGAPGEMTCAMSGCHTGNLNTGTGSVSLLNPPSAYVPGTTYTMQVQVSEPSRTKFGFELVALRQGNLQAGTISLIDANNTAIQTLSGKTYLTHRNATGNNVWLFSWQAPSSNVGPITFYMAGNAANNNNSNTGDNIYTSNFVLNPGTSTGIKEDEAKAVNVFPNPASAKLNVTAPEKPQTLKVLDFAGREVFIQTENNAENAIDVSNYPSGTYFLQVEQEKTIQMKRFVVQH